jgi:hypothetical protein
MTATICTEDTTGQTSFVAAPRISIEFDPFALGAGKPSDEGFVAEEWGYESEWGVFWGCYVASPADFPCVFGQGNSTHWALVDLARELRAWNWKVEPDLTPRAQLAHAARNLDQPQLVRYLKCHAAPPELGSGYALVLR